MHQRRFEVFCIGLILAIATPVWAQNSATQRQIDGILNTEILKGAQVAILVKSLESGRVIYEKNPDLKLHPASNNKIITTVAALHILGPQYRWKTELYAGRMKKGVADHIYLVGGGDPGFVTESLWTIVREAKQAGLKRVRGDLVIDDTFFTRDTMAPGYDDKDGDSAYRAASSALSLNSNAFTASLKPGRRVGAPARMILRPNHGHFLVVNQAKTSRRGREQLSLKATAHGSGTKVTLTGTIPRKHRGVAVRRRVDNPSRFTAETARLFLEKEGIKIGGKIRVGRRPKEAQLIGRKTSRTAGEIVADVNKLSNNLMAENLLRTIGVHKTGVGDWSKSSQAVSEFLKERFGLDGFRYDNGSGLFGQTSFSPRDLVTILTGMTKLNPALPEFEASLPISGIDGTLKKRLRDIKRGAVRAKTGTLDGVICLSGYLYAKNGERLVFSMLTNDVQAKGWQVRRIQDRILRVLGGYPSPKKK